MDERKQENTSSQGQPLCAAREMVAAEVATRMMEGLSMQVRDLTILCAMLPTQMTPEQDRAVRNILLNYRR